LEKNPLGGAERDEALEEIRKNNPGAEMSFWQEWIASE
jgi:hypothetical protein